MPLSRWKKLKSREFHKNPFWTYKIDDFVIPSSGFKGTYYYVHTSGSSMIIPVTGDNKILMVKQYRYLNKKFSLEFPCGGNKEGMTPLETARVELMEETGFSADRFKHAGKFCPFNGVTDEFCQVYIASGLKVDPRKADDSEELSVHSFTPEEVDKMMRDGSIFDGMTMAAWALAWEKVLEVTEAVK